MTYLGRRISIVSVVRPEEVAALDATWTEAVVLLLCSREVMPNESQLWEFLANARPLALLIAGVDAEQRFSEFLIAVGRRWRTEDPGLMTGVSGADPEEAVQTLLQATWPSERRFDDWRSYLLIDLGGLGNTLALAAQRLKDSDESPPT